MNAPAISDFWLGALSAYGTLASLALLGVAGFAAWVYSFVSRFRELNATRLNGVTSAEIVCDPKPQPMIIEVGKQ